MCMYDYRILLFGLHLIEKYLRFLKHFFSSSMIKDLKYALKIIFFKIRF